MTVQFCFYMLPIFYNKKLNISQGKKKRREKNVE